MQSFSNDELKKIELDPVGLPRIIRQIQFEKGNNPFDFGVLSDGRIVVVYECTIFLYNNENPKSICQLKYTNDNPSLLKLTIIKNKIFINTHSKIYEICLEKSQPALEEHKSTNSGDDNPLSELSFKIVKQYSHLKMPPIDLGNDEKVLIETYGCTSFLDVSKLSLKKEGYRTISAMKIDNATFIVLNQSETESLANINVWQKKLNQWACVATANFNLELANHNFLCSSDNQYLIFSYSTEKSKITPVQIDLSGHAKISVYSPWDVSCGFPVGTSFKNVSNPERGDDFIFDPHTLLFYKEELKGSISRLYYLDLASRSLKRLMLGDFSFNIIRITAISSNEIYYVGCYWDDMDISNGLYVINSLKIPHTQFPKTRSKCLDEVSNTTGIFKVICNSIIDYTGMTYDLSSNAEQSPLESKLHYMDVADENQKRIETFKKQDDRLKTLRARSDLTYQALFRKQQEYDDAKAKLHDESFKLSAIWDYLKSNPEKIQNLERLKTLFSSNAQDVDVDEVYKLVFS